MLKHAFCLEAGAYPRLLETFKSLESPGAKAVLIHLASGEFYFFPPDIEDKITVPNGKYYTREDRSLLTKEDFEVLFEKVDEFSTHVFTDLFAYAFEDMYGYPYGSFRSVTDYNGDSMFFFAGTFPFPENHIYDNLRQLTREKYKEQLEEFFSTLTGEKQKLELAMCEEYIKE